MYGFKISEKFRGLNEAVTECLIKSLDGHFDAPTVSDDAVLYIDLLLNLEISGIDMNSMLKNYFSNNPDAFLKPIIKKRC